MSTPAENQARGEAPTVAQLQQTVERVFDWIDTVLVNDVRPNTQAARAALRDLVAAIDQARMNVMIECLRAEKFDREHGVTLPGDSALAVVFAGFEEYVSTTKQRRARLDGAR